MGDSLSPTHLRMGWGCYGKATVSPEISPTLHIRSWSHLTAAAGRRRGHVGHNLHVHPESLVLLKHVDTLYLSLGLKQFLPLKPSPGASVIAYSCSCNTYLICILTYSHAQPGAKFRLSNRFETVHCDTCYALPDHSYSAPNENNETTVKKTLVQMI